MKPNVYFVGKAGCGKSYSVNFLKSKGYIEGKMATSIYGIAQFYFGMTDKNRQLLQHLGTESGRELIDKDIWINRFVEDCKIAQNTYKQLYNKEVSFAVSDVRFTNEHKVLQKAGWIGIYLNVPDEIRLIRLINRDGKTQEETFNHPSEKEMELFKDELIQVDASGTEFEMYNNIEKALDLL